MKGALLSRMEGRKRAMWNVGATSIRLTLLSQQMGSPLSTCSIHARITLNFEGISGTGVQPLPHLPTILHPPSPPRHTLSLLWISICKPMNALNAGLKCISGAATRSLQPLPLSPSGTPYKHVEYRSLGMLHVIEASLQCHQMDLLA